MTQKYTYRYIVYNNHRLAFFILRCNFLEKKFSLALTFENALKKLPQIDTSFTQNSSYLPIGNSPGGTKLAQQLNHLQLDEHKLGSIANNSDSQYPVNSIY